MAYNGKRELLSIKRRQALQPQISVAAKLGIAQSQYSNIENGYVTPTEEQAAVLIDMFNLPNDYFENGAGKDNGEEQNL